MPFKYEVSKGQIIQDVIYVVASSFDDKRGALWSVWSEDWEGLPKLKFNLDKDKKWGELGKKNMRNFIEFLTKDFYSVTGKTTFKEEFVTCGGISLENINIKTMESKIVNDLYFAGEVLDIDGITGGYNFQSAWTTGFIAGKLGE